MNIEKYETQAEDHHLRYTFLSKGNKDIEKIIAYEKLSYQIPIPFADPIDAYNLAFGDRKGFTDKIDDKANSNNGDMRKVFNTVLNTIPIFFSKYANSCIAVRGSDERRIRTYCFYVSRNYETLIKDYTFYGITGTTLRPFIKGTVYESVVFMPK